MSSDKRTTPGASTGTPGDAKCVTEILGEAAKNIEVNCGGTKCANSHTSISNFKIFQGVIPRISVKKRGGSKMGRKERGEVVSWLSWGCVPMQYIVRHLLQKLANFGML